MRRSTFRRTRGVHRQGRGAPARCSLRPPSGAGGSVTAETAVLLPVLLVVLAAAISVLACIGAQLRCLDAARSAARVAARGDAADLVRGTAERLAPPGATVSLVSTPDTVEVVVTAQVRPLGSALRLPTVGVSGRAVAGREDLP